MLDVSVSVLAEHQSTAKRLVFMRREYDIRQQDEADDAMRRQFIVYDWTTSGIFIALIVVVALLLLVLPS
jgi:hypothetical protein